MSRRSLDCDIVAAPFPIISLIISAGGVACFASRSRHLISCVPFPVSPCSVACLARRLYLTSLIISSVISGNSACLPPCVPPCVPFYGSPCVSFLASRSVSRLVRSSRSPLGDAIAALPDRSTCRSPARSHRSPRPACRLGWERDGTGRLPRHRLSALPPLLALDGVSPACVSSLRSACSVSCRRLCR